MHSAQQAHWNAALSVIWYLKYSLFQGITFPKENDVNLIVDYDSNHASCLLKTGGLKEKCLVNFQPNFRIS